MIDVAVIGVGGWGSNLARNYYEIPTARLKYICDLDQGKLARIERKYPGSVLTTSYEEVLNDRELSAVVVATTAASHYQLAKAALEADKDVYVEKPFVLRVSEAEELTALAKARQKILMVGHLLVYHPVILMLRELIRAGERGDIFYVYSQRLNLGTVREDENALWNFAPHDISSILFLLDQEPVDVTARGESYLRPGTEDVVFLSLAFRDRLMANIHVSWLDPHKVRKLTIVGSRKMAVFDDLASSEKLRIYDKGADIRNEYETYAEYVGLRVGDITIPYVKVREPLRDECLHFLECVEERSRPRSDGNNGVQIVKVLEAADASLKNNGEPVAVNQEADRFRIVSEG